VARTSARPAAARDERRWTPLRLDRFELATLAVLLAFGAAVLAGLLVRVLLRGDLFAGADSYVTVDQLQYLNWIRQASDHVAVANLYDLAESERSFVHPGVLLSALLHQLGLGLVASFQVLKLPATLLLFAGVLLYVHRFLPRPGDRRMALVLALFSVSPVAAAVGWSGLGSDKQKLQLDFVAGEMWTGHYLWGYMFTAVAVALLPLGLLAYERGRARGRRSLIVASAAAGLLSAWLQPWQGATFVMVIVVAEAILLRGRLTRGTALSAGADLALPLAATAAPLLYYFVLSRVDAAWELAGKANESGGWPLWVMVVGLAPLALPALLAYRMPAPDFGAVALRLWPIAALLVFYTPAGTFPAHAFQGLTIPLVILAVLAIRARLGARPLPIGLGAAILLVMVVPGVAYRVDQLRGAVNAGLQPFFLEDDEHDALRYLDRVSEGGGVLTTFFSGQAVPAYTGRATYVGASSWTPNFKLRGAFAASLFAGELDRRQAERLIRGTGARFLYSDCQGHPDIGPIVARVTGPPRRFGCATVYRVR
jgi:hypothetical protein